jgi:hypothetical protein
MKKKSTSKRCAGCVKYRTKECNKNVNGYAKACEDYEKNNWIGKITP